MALQIEGQLFEIGTTAMTELARKRAAFLQYRKGHTDEQVAVHVHSSILLTLHATGQHGHIAPSDKILNRNNIKKNSGRVLTVVGSDYPFVIMTELPSGDTLITTPEEI